MLDFITVPFGKFLYFIYETLAFKNYGLAIILFTIVIRVALLPLTIKQYKSTSKMQEVQPLIQDIQRKYKNDKEKLNAELMKVYQENKVNPAGGCLPLLIQMPILFALFYAISRPLTYMLGMKDQIASLLTKYGITGRVAYPEIEIIKAAGKAGEPLINMNFLGLNLGNVPTWHVDKLFSDPMYLGLFLIPILAVGTTYLSTKLSMAKAAQGAGSSMNNTMMLIGPLMTLLFSFQFPAGMGLYWIIGNLVQITQQLYLNKYVLKKKEVVK